MTRIALCGKLRSGKDEVAAHIALKHAGFFRLAFGTALKDAYHGLFPWVPKDPKPRAGYQSFGQEMRRLYGDDLWIRHVARDVEILEKVYGCRSIVITDLRQQNEYEWCRANGFTIVRVTAPDAERLARARKAGDDFDESDLTHDTEMHVDEFAVDYEIVNDGTLDELWAKVDDVMAKIKEDE